MHTPLPLREHFAKLIKQVQSSPHTTSRVRYSVILTGFEYKIQRWLETMTPIERQRRFTTSEVIALAHLQGKNGPSPGDRLVSQALRLHGFVPCRDWTVAGRNKRYWLYKEQQ